jgi:hypothetical protein
MFWSWVLLLLCGGLGGANVARGMLAISLQEVLPETSLPLWLLGWVYIVWGIAFLICTVMALRPKDRPRWLLPGCGAAYQITGWILRIFGDVSTYARQLWLRDAVLSLLFLVVVVLLDYLSRRKGRDKWANQA